MSRSRLSYGVPEGPVGTARTFEEFINPINDKTYVPNEQLRFEIPCGRRNAYIDPTKTSLRFTLTNRCLLSTGSSATAQLDGSAHSVIKRLKLFDRQGGTLLEDIDEYNALYHIILNATASPEELSATRSTTEGFLPARAGISYAPTGNQSTLFVDPASATKSYQGQFFATTGTSASESSSGAEYANGNAQTFQIPLMSTIGTLNDKYIPAHRLTRPMYLELTLAPGKDVFLNTSGSLNDSVVVVDNNISAYGVTPTNAPYVNGQDVVATQNYAISNVALRVTYLQIDDETQASIDQMVGGKYVWTNQSYRRFLSPLPQNNTYLYNAYIPGRFSSARAIMSVLRQPLQQIPASRYVSSFSRFGATNVQYRLGEKPVPQRASNFVAEMATQLFDVFRTYHKNFTPTNSITLISFLKPVPLVDMDAPGTFCMAVDLGGPCGNAFDTFMGGAQTLGEDITLSFRTNPQYTDTSPINLDSFVLHDVLFSIDANGNFTAET